VLASDVDLAVTLAPKLDDMDEFQVVLDREFVATDCFTRHQPTVVPARTLLSQHL
jgi:hypothetical protein